MYTRRPVPEKYDRGWVGTELQNQERAIRGALVRKVTTSQLQVANDRTMWFNTTAGNLTYTLLAANMCSPFEFAVKNIGTGGNTLTIVGTVDGVASPVLADGKGKWIQCDGIEYQTLADV